MANKIQQLKYNQAIDDITYLILNYPLELQNLLRTYGTVFRGKASGEALIDETVELLKDGNPAFAKALATLITRLSNREDVFWGAIAKGAVGILGGLFKKKKRGGSSNNAAAAQAAAAKADMDRRMQQMRAEQQRREAERRRQEEQRRQEEMRRREEQKRREAEAKKKTNMMLMIGGGVVVLGIGAAILMKSNKPPMPYGGQRAPMPQ